MTNNNRYKQSLAKELLKISLEIIDSEKISSEELKKIYYKLKLITDDLKNLVLEWDSMKDPPPEVLQKTSPESNPLPIIEQNTPPPPKKVKQETQLEVAKELPTVEKRIQKEGKRKTLNQQFVENEEQTVFEKLQSKIDVSSNKVNERLKNIEKSLQEELKIKEKLSLVEKIVISSTFFSENIKDTNEFLEKYLSKDIDKSAIIRNFSTKHNWSEDDIQELSEKLKNL